MLRIMGSYSIVIHRQFEWAKRSLYFAEESFAKLMTSGVKQTFLSPQ
jgi:hypothetical protein